MVLQRIRLTLYILGSFLKFFALAYIIPLVTALHYGEDWRIFLYSLLITLGVGLALERGFRTDRPIERADGFSVVAFTWLFIPLLGTLPYLFPPMGLGFLDAFFEAMSGFTGTGATILGVLEGLPHGVLLWRNLTQWLGGMGVIALFVAILPSLAVGGSQLFGREFPGPLRERLRPRFKTTARILWSIYAGLTAAEVALLCLGARLPLFDSICLSFSTLSTGGFAPATLNMAHPAYAGPVAQYVVMAFMFLGGTNFVVHYHVLRGNFGILKDEEFRLYVIVLLSAMLLLAVSQGSSSYRDGLFQAVSIMTCTGFSSANFALWDSGPRMVLLVLMIIGACGGSTGGGIKVVRALTLMKHTGVMMKRAISPKAVIPLKYNQKPLAGGIVRDVVSFVFLYFLVAIVAAISLSFLGLNAETSLSAVLTSLANCGPGLGDVGPALNYAELRGAAKGILIVCMWLGRLELFTVLMLLSPRFWRTQSPL
jgi:trk system potassium uptake protein